MALFRPTFSFTRKIRARSDTLCLERLSEAKFSVDRREHFIFRGSDSAFCSCDYGMLPVPRVDDSTSMGSVDRKQIASVDLGMFLAMLVKTFWLIHAKGASGSVGSFEIQLAKASDSTAIAVCSARSIEYVKSLGADSVFAPSELDMVPKSRQPSLIYALPSTLLSQKTA